MSDLVKIEATGLTQVIVRLRSIPDAVRRALELAVNTEALNLVAYIKSAKLSGQVLGQRTQRLVRAVHVLSLERGTDAVVASVGVNLGDAAYAAFWEYGFTGTEMVRQHLRTITQVFGKPVDPHEITVQAHSRQVNQPARSYLRSSLADRQDTIRENIQNAVFGAVRAATAS